MPPPSTLVCKECGYVNEAERVYCHGCGAKLDRTVILAEQEKLTVSREQKQREVRKMMTPGGNSIGKGLVMLVKTVAWAALAAAVIQIVRPPDNVPPLPKKGEVLNLPQIGTDLERLTAAPAGRGLLFHEADLNAFLLKKPFRKVPSWFTDVIPLPRSFVNLDNGEARLTLEVDLAGYPIYVGITAQPKDDPKAGLTPQWVGLNLGRLTLPAAVAQAASPAIPTLMDSVKQELQMLSRLGAAEITKGQVVLRSRGPQAAPAGAPNAAAPRASVH